jgi:hypothetical protein
VVCKEDKDEVKRSHVIEKEKKKLWTGRAEEVEEDAII